MRVVQEVIVSNQHSKNDIKLPFCVNFSQSMRQSGQYSNFPLSYHILSTAGGFKKIAGKGGGFEYLILIFYMPKGPLKSNIQSIGNIISFRIYDTYFHHERVIKIFFSRALLQSSSA